MYDILQLNDMLVPELLDIAEQQNIPDTENLEKQELIYKILDNQASSNQPAEKKEAPAEKPKRKRIVKSAAKKEKSTESKPAAADKEPKEKKTEDKKKSTK